MLATKAFSHVIAHGHDGTFYAASLSPRTVALGGQRREHLAWGADMMGIDARDFLLSPESGLDNPTAIAIGNDLVLRLLHAYGMIDYMTTAELPPGIADALRGFIDEKGYYARTDDRRALSVRPEGGAFGLSQTDREQPVSTPSGREGRNGAGARNARPAGKGSQGRLLEGFAQQQANLPLPVARGFEVLRDQTGLRRAISEVKAALSPTSLEGARPMEHLIRQHGADAARAFDQAVHALEAVRWALDRAGRDEQIAFTDRMEHGTPQPTPEFQAVATTLRQILDDWAGKVQGLGRGYLSSAIENYMGHVYSNYDQWVAGKPGVGSSKAVHSMGSKRPLRGSGSFLKQRSFPTQLDAIKAGLIPLTYNPIDLQLLKIREMQKFYYGTRLADAMKQSGIARWVPEGDSFDAERSGWVRLDDRIFQPRLSMQGVPGKVEPGNWYAPEPAARLFNRYMSRGLFGQSVIYDTMRMAGNALNSLQLGFSGYHAVFITLDTMISRVALGLQQASEGRLGTAGGSLIAGTTPAALVKTVRDGSKLRKAWLEPGIAGPLWQRTAQDLAIGGGRIKMGSFYQSASSGSFFRHIGDLKDPRSVFYQVRQMFRDAPGPLQRFVTVPLQTAGRAMETTMAPIMEYMVPRAKLGVFAQLAQDWHDQHPQWTQQERADAMMRIWDSVENRMGQVTYDNLFWHKALKDMAFVTQRSTGWNLGTVRELGGAGVDAAQAAGNALRGRLPQMTYRMGYALALPIVVGIYGALLTYLFTGQSPQSVMDYFYPRTGSKTATGSDERLSLPGYIKDVVDVARDPIQTALNKTSPLVSMIAEIAQNRDYYGGSIYDPERDANPAAAYAAYLLGEVQPFSFRAQGRLNDQGAPAWQQGMSFAGIQPAPKSITDPEREEAWQTRQRALAYRRRLREPGHAQP